MAKKTHTQGSCFETVAQSLRTFGYPSATAQMIKDTWDAMESGKEGHDLPHGIIGMFAESQLNEVRKEVRAMKP